MFICEKGGYCVDPCEGCEYYIELAPVVRCKDCKHGEIDDPDFPYQYYCHMGHMWNDAYHFCADGEQEG